MNRILMPTMVVLALAVVIYLIVARLPDVPESSAETTMEGPIRLLDEPQELPDFGFIDAGGRPLSLEDYRGKVVLLNIWATWCPPCRQEMPALDRLQAMLGEEGFVVLPISTDRNGVAPVERFYKRAEIRSLGIYLDPDNEVAAALQVPGLPTTFLIDRQGQALGVRIGPAEWDSEETQAMIRRQLQAPAR